MEYFSPIVLMGLLGLCHVGEFVFLLRRVVDGGGEVGGSDERNMLIDVVIVFFMHKWL